MLSICRTMHIELYSSWIASVDKCTYPRGEEKPLSENVASLLTNDQKIIAYQCAITGDKRRKFAETRRKLPAMNIVQNPKKRPYGTPPTYDRPQCPTLQHRNIRRSSARSPIMRRCKTSNHRQKTRRRIAAHSIRSCHRIRGSLQLRGRN